jgi:hypothetical protein
MNLLLYTQADYEPGERLQKRIEASPGRKALFVCNRVEQLKRKLVRFQGKPEIAVLIPGNQRNLAELHSIKELLGELPIILILPGRENDVISKGFSLQPRFVSYADSDFTDVSAVLEKMIARIEMHKSEEMARYSDCQ